MNEENKYFYNDENTENTDVIKADRFNPFGNAEEYAGYNQDYRTIVPQISMDNCSIPDVPDEREKRSIKQYYNKVGIMLIIQVLGVNLIAMLFGLISGIFLGAASGGSAEVIESVTNNSSLNISITGMGYMIMNILVFFIGCRITGIDRSSLFGTKNLDGLTMARYIAIALFLQSFSVLFAGMFVVPLFDSIFDTDTYEKLSQMDSMSSVTQIIATCLYTCVVAPITEELVLRGFVLKNLSRANQRFGIIASAFLFGLIHDNVPQFILAFLVGIFLAYVTIKHNSIIPSIILHIIINTTSTIISLIAEMDAGLGDIVSVVWELAALIIGVVIFIISVALKKDRLPKPTQAQKNRGVPLFFSSPAVIIVIAAHLILSYMYISL